MEGVISVCVWVKQYNLLQMILTNQKEREQAL